MAAKYLYAIGGCVWQARNDAELLRVWNAHRDRRAGELVERQMQQLEVCENQQAARLRHLDNQGDNLIRQCRDLLWQHVDQRFAIQLSRKTAVTKVHNAVVGLRVAGCHIIDAALSVRTKQIS